MIIRNYSKSVYSTLLSLAQRWFSFPLADSEDNVADLRPGVSVLCTAALTFSGGPAREARQHWIFLQMSLESGQI